MILIEIAFVLLAIVCNIPLYWVAYRIITNKARKEENV